MRVSLPISTLPPCPPPSTRPAAQPSLSAKSGVMFPSPTRPRMPSVPKYLRVTLLPVHPIYSVEPLAKLVRAGDLSAEMAGKKDSASPGVKIGS